SVLRVIAGASADSYGGSGAGSSRGCERRAAWGAASRRAEADGELLLPRPARPRLPSWMIFASATTHRRRPEQLTHGGKRAIDALGAQQPGLRGADELRQRRAAAQLRDKARFGGETRGVHGTTIGQRIDLVRREVHEARLSNKRGHQGRRSLRHEKAGPAHLAKRLRQRDDVSRSDIEGARHIATCHQKQSS